MNYPINMSKKEQLMAVLQEMGYSPKCDDDGDIFMVYQMKTIYFLIQEDDEDNFLSIMFPQFMDIEEGKEGLSLAICNKMTRELKLAKVYVDQTFKTVSSMCEFFYVNEEALKFCIKRSLCTIGILRSQYLKTQKELTD
ncbi:MAG: YbjN domain-containing protein [Bacteroidales bacterium]|nr:YbjN domain-containing protein [Bacteroidales bacterium]